MSDYKTSLEYGFGNWQIYVYKDGALASDKDKQPPPVKGVLVIDGNKYAVKSVDLTQALLVVPAGNVAYALNIDNLIKG